MDPGEGKVGVWGVGLRQSQALLNKDVPQCSQMLTLGSLCFRHYTTNLYLSQGFFFFLGNRLSGVANVISDVAVQQKKKSPLKDQTRR